MASTIQDFVNYAEKHIKGDEKGEAQIFLDHFFQALGYTDGLKGAGADCEFRIKDEDKHSTKFADLVWKPKVLIEMKKKGENLSIHLQQAFTYWANLVPDRPQYVVLCNFDEFWIFDFNKDIYRPQDKILIKDLPDKIIAFAFLFPKPEKPLFGYNNEDVTEKAAYFVSNMYKSLLQRRIEPEISLKYCLQLILTMFAEHIELLPKQIFTRIISELINEPGTGSDLVPKSFDLIGNLFQAMNTQGITPGGAYKGVDYFNGGLFDKIYHIELTKWEIGLIETAASFNWRNVNPAIFGSIFETALETNERHKLGAHYTHELDIKKIVDPVIVQPWNDKIDKAQSLDDYFNLLTDLSQFKVLDPACGSGNFLFIAFKEMKTLEKRLLFEIRSKFNKLADAKRFVPFLMDYKYVNTNQFYGIDIKPFAVELAKVTLMIAKELSWLEAREDHDNKFKPLPLDNLDSNILCEDSLLNDDGSQRRWPDADAIIGNPPYQSKNKMQKEFGAEYVDKLRKAYPEVPGRADFCVYWFYKAHQNLKPNHFAGLVGTNTIRQNYSREGSLDYIVQNGGTIINAVSSEAWMGEAAVFVSIVCWTKGQFSKEKILYYYDSKGQLHKAIMPVISSSLSLKTDVTTARSLKCNKEPKVVFQGQTHGHEGFLLSAAHARAMLKLHPEYAEVLKPFLIGDELVSNLNAQPKRFVIDFSLKDLNQASTYKDIFKKIEKEVLPGRETRAKEQDNENKAVLKANPKAKVNKHHINFYNSWWQLSYGREDMLHAISQMKRYIACARVTQRPIFEFISSDISPNDKVMCFAFDDDYSFGIIQSGLHWLWFTEKCTTLAETPNYNSASIWDTFPWPQNPNNQQIDKVANASRALRDERNRVMNEGKQSLRDIYRNLEKPGKNSIKDLQHALDKAVLEAFGFDASTDLLTQLLALNDQVSEKEEKGEKVQSPGLPDWYKDKDRLVSDDCVRFLG
jgi:hypothetical protein